MPRRFVFVFALLLAAAAARAQDAGPVYGTVRGDRYYSPTGVFNVRIPVDLEFNGSISDTPNVVTFEDPFRHISIAAVPLDPIQRWDYQTEDPRDYLKTFFEQYVFRDFYRTNPKASFERSARFVPGMFGGAFVAYVLLPGGSMFDSPDDHIANTDVPVAKRGNLLFVHDGYIFVISTELAERITEGKSFKLTSDQEDVLLRDRLFDIADKIRFTTPPKPVTP